MPLPLYEKYQNPNNPILITLVLQDFGSFEAFGVEMVRNSRNVNLILLISLLRSYQKGFKCLIFYGFLVDQLSSGSAVNATSAPAVREA